MTKVQIGPNDGAYDVLGVGGCWSDRLYARSFLSQMRNSHITAFKQGTFEGQQAFLCISWS